MKQIQPELHRLTTLQRQILKWIRSEGGGCLPADRLFTTMYFNHTLSHPDIILLGERLSEAVEQLARSGYVEIRHDSLAKVKFPSLYEFGSIAKNVEMGNDDRFYWKSGIAPEVALTDFGSHYAARMA